jgi:hypothetical protein
MAFTTTKQYGFRVFLIRLLYSVVRCVRCNPMCTNTHLNTRNHIASISTIVSSLYVDRLVHIGYTANNNLTEYNNQC